MISKENGLEKHVGLSSAITFVTSTCVYENRLSCEGKLESLARRRVSNLDCPLCSPQIAAICESQYEKTQPRNQRDRGGAHLSSTKTTVGSEEWHLWFDLVKKINSNRNPPICIPRAPGLRRPVGLNPLGSAATRDLRNRAGPGPGGNGRASRQGRPRSGAVGWRESLRSRAFRGQRRDTI